MTVGNLHSVALIDLAYSVDDSPVRWEPSFCSLDRLTGPRTNPKTGLGTFIL